MDFHILSQSGTNLVACNWNLEDEVQELAFLCFAYSLLAQIPELSNLCNANPSIDLILICTFLLP
jgi:hypothetical protein